MTIMQNVGRLEPDATYIYEKVNGKTYARKIGETERILIGEDYDYDPMASYREWAEIRDLAEHHPALQDALERVKVLYELLKQEQPIQHHPV